MNQPREIRRCASCLGEAEVVDGIAWHHWTPRGDQCSARKVEGPVLRVELIRVDFADRWSVAQAFAKRQQASAKRLPNGFHMHRQRIARGRRVVELCTAHGPWLYRGRIEIDEVGGPGSAAVAREAAWLTYLEDVDEVRRLLGYEVKS